MRARRRRVARPIFEALRDILPPLILSRLVLLAMTLTAPQWHAAVPDPGRFLSPAPSIGNPLLNRWYRWDAAWYVRVAGNGPQMGYSRYTEDPQHGFGGFAFFPLYPVVVHAAALVIPGAAETVPSGDPPRPRLVETAMGVSTIAFALALVVLYALARRRFGTSTGRRTVWLLCFFPTSLFFSAAYSESLFFLLLVLFFLALDTERWSLAGLAGGLAAATRSLGVGLVVPYAAMWWHYTMAHTKTWPRRLYAALPIVIIPLGLLAYMAYLGHEWGNPLQFRDAERAWSRSFALPWVGIIDGITWSLRGLPHGDWSPHGVLLSGLLSLSQPQWRGLTDALYAVVFLVLTALAWRGLDWPERLYTVVFWLYVLCEPQISHPDYPDTLISMPRFLLVLVPLWIWLGRSRWRTGLVLIPSVGLFLFYTARWVNGGWVG